MSNQVVKRGNIGKVAISQKFAPKKWYPEHLQRKKILSVDSVDSNHLIMDDSIDGGRTRSQGTFEPSNS